MTTFIPLKIAVLTISDTRNQESDRSGPLLAQLIQDAGHRVIDRAIIADERDQIRNQVLAWVAIADVVIATGGTGLGERDVTPEAFQSLYDKEITGFGELFRLISYESIGPSTIQSRATGGIIGQTYLFALPGSPGACRDAWSRILVHQLDSRQKPCNLVALRPRHERP